MAAIGGFRSDLSITRKTDGNFGNVSAGCFVFQSRVSTKTVVNELNCFCFHHIKNILLTELSRSVWENLDLGRVYRLSHTDLLLG